MSDLLFIFILDPFFLWIFSMKNYHTLWKGIKDPPTRLALCVAGSVWQAVSLVSHFVSFCRLPLCWHCHAPLGPIRPSIVAQTQTDITHRDECRWRQRFPLSGSQHARLPIFLSSQSINILRFIFNTPELSYYLYISSYGASSSFMSLLRDFQGTSSLHLFFN